VSGLLIVSADDWGRDAATTDAILACFEAGRITSTSALVHLEDSRRAARLALAAGLNVGLHLNFSEPYSAAGVPDELRRRQSRLARRFRGLGLHIMRWLYDPLIQTDVERCILDQMEEFERLYGQAPTHIDGHKHVHVSPNVLFARALQRGMKLRTSLWLPGRPSLLAPGRLLRRRIMSRRFVSPAFLFDINDREHALGLVDEHNVELMVHPANRAELDVLLSEEWGRAIRGRRLGSFADL
jgi:predicted glycoside hydrolase/deacetylase ChbG (UPF0249 family)